MYELVFPQGQLVHVPDGQFPPQVRDVTERTNKNMNNILAKVVLPKKSTIIFCFLFNNKIIRYALSKLIKIDSIEEIIIEFIFFINFFIFELNILFKKSLLIVEII